jgi:hypothetical protein
MQRLDTTAIYVLLHFWSSEAAISVVRKIPALHAYPKNSSSGPNPPIP